MNSRKKPGVPPDDNKHEYPGGPTWVAKEYDPRLMEKKRFSVLKAIAAWFRDHVLAGVIIGVLVALATIYATKYSQSEENKKQPVTTETPATK